MTIESLAVYLKDNHHADMAIKTLHKKYIRGTFNMRRARHEFYEIVKNNPEFNSYNKASDQRKVLNYLVKYFMTDIINGI